MKDCTKQTLEAFRPQITAKEAVNFCLSQLYKDRRHSINEELATRLTYEELIGALLLARDTVEEKAELEEHMDYLDTRARKLDEELDDVQFENLCLQLEVSE